MKIGCINLINVEGNFFVAIKCSKGRGYILPGGKHEVGETFHQAASRELLEEAGLIANNQEYFFHAPDAFDYTCITFMTHIKTNFQTSCEEEVFLVTWNELLQSHYKAYYGLLKDHFERNKKNYYAYSLNDFNKTNIKLLERI